LAWLSTAAGRHEREPEPIREPILAYRAWRVEAEQLMSCTCSCLWSPRERMDARCNQNGLHANVPVWECSCGFYAYKTERALEESPYLRPDQKMAVWGRVALWGRVIDHGLGYRAQHAYPQLLYLAGNAHDDLVRRVAESYAIECVPALAPKD
jgi:hypothetical protein